MRRTIVVILLPVILWAWNTDIRVWSKQDTVTSSYDLVVPSDSEYFVVVRTQDTMASYMHIYYTTNYGETWQPLDSSYAYASGYTDLLNINMTYFMDTLYILYPLTHTNYFPFLVKPMNQRHWQNRAGYFPLDSIQTAFMTIAKNEAHTPYFYVIALGWKGDTVKYSILKSSDFGSSWNEVFTRLISTNTTPKRILKSFSSYDYGDSVRLIMAYTYENSSNSTYSIYYNVLSDTMGSELAERVSFNSIITQQTANVATAALRGMEVIAYADGGELHIVYSPDNWNTLHPLQFDNTNYDSIYSVDMVPWFSTFGQGGLNIVFATILGSGTIDIEAFYQEVYRTGDSLYMNGTPIQVSSETYNGPYTYVFNLSPYYYPRIKNRSDFAVPYVLWHRDYTHTSGFLPIYDSTVFYIDYMSNDQVKEQSERVFNNTVSLNLTGNTLVLKSTGLNGRKEIQLIDVTGRTVSQNSIIFRNGKARYSVKNLKDGLYFLIIKGKSTHLKGKFVKIR